MKMYSDKVELNKAIVKFINKVAPLLIDELNKGFKQKDNGELYKTDAERLRTIYKNDDLRAFLDVSGYSIVLKVDGHYSAHKHAYTGCIYNAEYVYLYNLNPNSPVEFKPLKAFTQKQLDAAHGKIKQLEEKARLATSEANKLKSRFKIGR